MYMHIQTASLTYTYVRIRNRILYLYVVYTQKSQVFVLYIDASLYFGVSIINYIGMGIDTRIGTCTCT